MRSSRAALAVFVAAAVAIGAEPGAIAASGSRPTMTLLKRALHPAARLGGLRVRMVLREHGGGFRQVARITARYDFRHRPAVELSGTIWVTSLLPGKPSHH